MNENKFFIGFITFLTLLVILSMFLLRAKTLEYDKNLQKYDISSTKNLENIVKLYSFKPTIAARVYAYSLSYRYESFQSKKRQSSTLENMDNNFTFCADRRIINLLLPFVFSKNEIVCNYDKNDDMIFEKYKQIFLESEQNEQQAKKDNKTDFSKNDGIHWYSENDIIPPGTPFAGSWKTFNVNLNDLTLPDPVKFGSDADKQEIQKVKNEIKITNADTEVAKTRKEKINYWAAGENTPSPLGLWLSIVDQNYRESMTDEQLLKIKKEVATLGYDAFVTCWHYKYALDVARPYMRDSEIISTIMTPNFPSYPSGHATLSGAIGTFLDSKYPIKGKTGYFYSLAQEAANTRLWSGIHFDVDNREGLKLGEEIMKDFVK